MRAVQKVEPVSEATSIVQVIERAALNPNIDVEKMERLLQMQERILAAQARASYTAALSEMQSELPVIVERGEIKDDRQAVRSRYALWEDINELIKPVLQKHGFALTFRTGHDGDKIVVTGVLSHKDGHSEETSIALPADVSGKKNAVQAIGSSTSYGKRYTAQALLNLTSRGEDDDGVAAGIGDTISDEQLADLQTLADNVGADIKKFCAYMKVKSLEQIPASKYEAAVAALEAKRTR